MYILDLPMEVYVRRQMLKIQLSQVIKTLANLHHSLQHKVELPRLVRRLMERHMI